MIMGVSPAVALTVAVFFMSITRGEWVELWAGLLGAIPAAVISAAVAAGVAVTVLGRTNEHQQKLAAKAAKEQRDTAFRQMDEQQRIAERQLIEQRGLAELQLAEQRTEAARAREQTAIAEVIVSTEALVIVVEKSEEALRAHIPSLQGAMGRWRVELGMVPMQGELMRWTTLLVVAAVEVVRSERSGGPGDAERAWQGLRLAVTQLSVVALSWTSADDSRRDRLQKRLEEYRLEREGQEKVPSEA